jgi:hypothetical protein
MPENEASKDQPRTPWNKGKLIGAKPPLRPKHVWSIRTRLMVEGRALALFNLAIDSKLHRDIDMKRFFGSRHVIAPFVQKNGCWGGQ